MLLFLGILFGMAFGAPQPWRCAPCTEEKVALCPPVPATCLERAQPAGCGCCPLCALPLGTACGVRTARCARGLTCRALPGEPWPLHALTRGQGACVSVQEEAETTPSTQATDVKDSSDPETVHSESVEITQEQLLDNFHLMAPSGDEGYILWNIISTYESIRDRDTTDIKKWKKPCQRELFKVLNRLAKAQQKAGEEIYKFYLPNCNKNGFYHSKQCETSLEGEAGLCWCVYPWNGKKIPGTSEVRGELNCHVYLSL
ncbi:PREDICTED: insulin-like growth factor-binding protein 1 [Elephantulus edwardii]|uniref:insulin-like growth factor-binding protein 1 n=1 Tax=Elephantulus edwardii TaxID=28737 RepID=UPI0003F0D351|nr:PREDICTED: insulin-like growth factor-binding protein 1 [Elephantulus edwardii]